MIEPEYIADEAQRATEDSYHEMEDCVRHHPGSAFLVTLLAGVALGLLVKALWPEPKPQNRALRLLDDIEDRLRDLAGPPLRKAGSMASDTVRDIRKGIREQEAGIERALRRVRSRVGSFFS